MADYAVTKADILQRDKLFEWIKSLETDAGFLINPFICNGVKSVIDGRRSAEFFRRTNSVHIVLDVTGVQYEGRGALLEVLSENETVAIVREPDNPYNGNNLRVNNNDGKSLGNLPADQANIISPMIDSGFAHIENGKVNYVEPLSKRGPKAKKGLLYVEFDLYMEREA